MQNETDPRVATNDPAPASEAGRGPAGPELPSLGGVLIGSALFMTGGMLMLTVIGFPAGILLFAIGLGWMLTPRKRQTR